MPLLYRGLTLFSLGGFSTNFAGLFFQSKFTLGLILHILAHIHDHFTAIMEITTTFSESCIEKMEETEND